MKGLINDIGKKKLLIIIGAFVGFIFFIIIILLLIHALNNKNLTYKDIENKLSVAAKDYYSENSDLLPQNDGESTTVDDATLTSSGNLKSMSDLTSKMDGVSCTGKVIVNRVDANYRYTPILDCGDKYKTITLVSYITDNEQRVFEGQGLYDLNGDLVYRGDDPNNYVRFSDKLYRIVKITNGEIVLILNGKIGYSVWDNRYNIDVESSNGINDYTISIISKTMSDIYKDVKLIKEEDKTLLAAYNLEIGRRKSVDNYNDGSIEKSTLYNNQYIGLLPLYDYINASLDVNCNAAEDESCVNYNYLNDFDEPWWLITGAYLNTYRAYYVAYDGEIGGANCSSSNAVRPVIHLSSSAIYVGGKGTLEEPYLVK